MHCYVLFMKKILLFISICLIVVSCGNKRAHDKSTPNDSTSLKSNDTSKVDTFQTKKDLENQVMDAVFSLPEVIENGNYLEKETKGKRHQLGMFAETPDDNGKDLYIVKIGEDNGDAFVPHFTFYVYVPSLKIKYYDPIQDEIISLEEWRKQPKEK